MLLSSFSSNRQLDAGGWALIGCFWLWRVWGCGTLGWSTARTSYCSRRRGRRRAGLQCGSARVCAGWSPEKTVSRSLRRYTERRWGDRRSQSSHWSCSVPPDLNWLLVKHLLETRTVQSLLNSCPLNFKKFTLQPTLMFTISLRGLKKLTGSFGQSGCFKKVISI